MNIRCALLLLITFALAACNPQHRMRQQDSTIRAFRLKPGQDLKREIDAFAREHNIQAGYILTCVGSLRKATLRLANQPGPTVRTDKFEIVSLVGTLSPEGSHLHIALSDSTGHTFGGHLMEGCEVYTTAEIVIGDAAHLRFRRLPDPETTYKELFIEHR